MSEQSATHGEDTPTPLVPGPELHAYGDLSHADLAGVEAGRLALVDLGGRFMISTELDGVAAEMGLEPYALYFQGRGGVFGTVSPTVLRRVFGTFAERAVMAGTADPVDPPVAVAGFARALDRWSEAHLPARPRLAHAIERVVDVPGGESLLLFAGWREQPRPDLDTPAGLGHQLFLLRELRGGIHLAALAALGLPAPQATLADPDGGPERLLRLGFGPAEISAFQEELPTSRRESLRLEAERLTGRTLVELVLEALTSDGGRVMAEDLQQLHAEVGTEPTPVDPPLRPTASTIRASRG